MNGWPGLNDKLSAHAAHSTSDITAHTQHCNYISHIAMSSLNKFQEYTLVCRHLVECSTPSPEGILPRIGAQQLGNCECRRSKPCTHACMHTHTHTQTASATTQCKSHHAVHTLLSHTHTHATHTHGTDYHAVQVKHHTHTHVTVRGRSDTTHARTHTEHYIYTITTTQ